MSGDLGETIIRGETAAHFGSLKTVPSLFQVLTISKSENRTQEQNKMTKFIVEAKLNWIPEKEVQDRLDFLGDAWDVVSAQTVGISYHGGESLEFAGPYGGNNHIMYVTTVALKQNKKFRPVKG
jgi:hypothetical protein